MAADNLARKAIIIPATQAPEGIQLRVAAYCRVSTDSEDQKNSFAAQNAYYTALITGKENWTLVDIYADEGITGTSAKKRPDFQRLLSDCRKGKIDKVLVKSISRFARNTTDCLEAVRELKALGISVVFEEQSIDTRVVSGEMLTAVLASCAQAESESISKNVRWSYQKRMEQGTYVPSSLPYGYRLRNAQIEIDVQEAEIVCEIFQSYLSGMSKLDIAQHLNQRGVVTRKGNLWDYCAIRYILKNERYAGDSLWQKSYSTESMPPKKVRNHGERHQYLAESTHPPIVTREIFQAAQMLVQERKAYNPTYGIASDDPLNGIIRCGHCGSKFRRKDVNGQIHWACRTHDKDTGLCPITAVPAEQIENAFLRMYYKLKHSGILEKLKDFLITVRSRQMLWHPDVIELNKQISNLTSQSHMLTVLNQQGAVDPDIFISQTNQLAQQLRKAKRQKEKLLERDGNDALSKTRELMEVLEYGPESLDAFDGELFRELVEKIIVESNERIRFRLINGLELPEKIERTVR